MTIPPIPPIGSLTPGSPAAAPTRGAAPGFAEALRGGLEEVSRLEHSADALIQTVASGGPASVGDLMVATTQAALGVDLLVQVRNRAVEAYQEVMRLPV